MEINELAALAKNGDLAAFEELYNRLARRLSYYIRKKIQNPQDAEDVLQEVFIKSYKGLSALRPGQIYFSSWLFSIAKNSINDFFRKKYRLPPIVSIDSDFDLPDERQLYKEIMVKSDWETVEANLNRLPVLYRSVLELRFVQDMPVGQVAVALNKSNLAIRMLQYHARKKLKQLSSPLVAVKA